MLFLQSTFIFSQENIKHKVVKGETLYAIAKSYNISINKIYQLNPSLKGATLQLGTIVTLPNTLIVKNTIEKPQFHKVKKGESFYSISKKYNLSVNDLELLNPSIETNKLKEGEKLSISKKEQAESIEIKKEEITQVKTEKIA